MASVFFITMILLLGQLGHSVEDACIPGNWKRLAPSEEMPGNDKIARMFAGQKGILIEDPESYGPRTLIDPNGREQTFKVYSAEDELREAAERGALVRHGRPPITLQEGTHTFVIFRDGRITTGKIDDSFEIGVKHLNIAFNPELAAQTEVVAAGEIRALSDGNYEWTMSSGSVTRRLINDLNVPRHHLHARTRDALAEAFGRSGQYRERSFPKPPPSRETMIRHCQDSLFLTVNKNACCQMVGLGC